MNTIMFILGAAWLGYGVLLMVIAIIKGVVIMITTKDK